MCLSNVFRLDNLRLKFDKALRDSFDTPVAMAALDGAIASTNIYISRQRASLSLASVKEVARWVTKMVDMLGLDASASAVDGGTKIGWSRVASGEGQVSNGNDMDQSNSEFHRGVSQFRDNIRSVAMNATGDLKKELLSLCDNLRDKVFVNEGIHLDDRDPGQPALIKYIPKAELITARQQQAELAAEKERKRDAIRLEKDRLEKEKLDQGKLSHLEMFRTEEYTQWDDEGIPTKDAQGEEITKSRSKKLRKDWERQKKKHETWLKSASSDA